MMHHASTLNIILLLAIVQAVAALLRAFGWMQVGGDLMGQGLVLLPFIGAVAILRGFIVFVVAALYVIFVIGAVLGSSWARWICCAAAVINLIVVLGAFAQGASVGDALLWSVIPIILLFYVFSGTGRLELKSA